MVHQQNFLQGYQKTRKLTEYLCMPLITEDYVVQSMPDVSPPKWHLAHTTWFFENFILVPYLKNYVQFNKTYAFIFNSYYQTVGKFLDRPHRGVLSRPETEEIYKYRTYVDEAISRLYSEMRDDRIVAALEQRLQLGIHHEQQHQELLLTDIKMNFWFNPLRPVYRKEKVIDFESDHSHPCHWIHFSGGVFSIGISKDGPKFAFDNERPAHSVFLDGFKLCSRLVTNGEFMEFIDASGYTKHEYWLSDGWLAVKRNTWNAPLYWEKHGEKWEVMTLFGMQPLNEQEPVCHISYYEADAFARWAQKRLPTEFEWERAAKSVAIIGNFLEQESLRPLVAQASADPSGLSLSQLYGDVWEWTRSSYLPYPGFKPLEGSLGEYNGKFMCNQMVLRGGSFATPASHIRPSYRNFFSPEARWQFTGLRLAEDI